MLWKMQDWQKLQTFALDASLLAGMQLTYKKLSKN